MKINVTIDCTPEEAKKMLNLPDLSKVVEDHVKENLATAALDPMGLFDMSKWYGKGKT